MSDGALEVESFPEGYHDVFTHFAGNRVDLVHVRATGLLEFGHLRAAFAHEWVPQLVEALQLAQRIASRPEPWKPWVAS